MKRALSLAFFLLLTTGLSLAQAPRPGSAQARTTVSVMDLNVTSGLSADEQKLLTDKLLNSLVDFRNFEVVERSKRDEILREQGFQLTGACSDASCLVEVGQLLGAQKMIGGTIGKLGNVYAVELRMIDIQTGRVDLTFSKNYTGDVSTLLGAMKQAAETFSRWRPGQEQEGQRGGLVIISNPEGAKLSIDGKEYGHAPTYAYPLDPGMHQVVAIMEGYNLYSEGVAVRPGSVDTLNISLVRPEGTLLISSAPWGAKVYLNGEYRGKAEKPGLRIDNLKKGNYNLKLRKPGFKERSRLVAVDAGVFKIDEKLARPKLVLELGAGAIAQGATGSVTYESVPWINGTGGAIENLFEAALGYRFSRYAALKAGYQYHTAWATNEGGDAVNTYHREYSAEFKLPSIMVGAAFYAPLGRFEPYAELRMGWLLKASAEEEIEYVGPQSTFIHQVYSDLPYKNYQIGMGGNLWLSSGTAFTFSFRYNLEVIEGLPNSYGISQTPADFSSWAFASHLGLLFAF